MQNDHNKIKTLCELASVIEELKQQGKKVVQCHGCFDLMHLGHIKHFEAAKKLGDVLVITITADDFVNKGPGRPAFPAHLRAESLAALECVSYVAINPSLNGTDAIKLLKPSIYVKGSEYEKAVTDTSRAIYREAEAVRSVGGEIQFTHEPTFSSTNLLKNHFSIYPDDVKEFLNDFSRHSTADEVLSKIKSIKDMKVLFIGEAVIDEYHYCSALGKSGKENLIAMKYKNEETFAGGVFACVNHLAGFCDNVDLVTCLGAKDSREEFVRKNLKPNVKTKFFFRDDACTTIKRRFVEPSFMNKLFSIYYFNDEDLSESLTCEIKEYLEENLPKYDLVVVLDYAHGFLNNELIKTICEKSKFLAVNTQTNAANFGFNVITKYPRADYVCIDWQEAKLAVQQKHLPIKELVKKIAEKIQTKKIIITTGHEGSISYDCLSNEYHATPVLSWKVIDRMGAGDAFLSITAPCVAAGMPMNIVGFIGNAVGAAAVGIVGNKSSVEPDQLYRFITTLLK